MFIISQILAFVGTGIDLTGKVMKNKKGILICLVTGSSLFVLSYIFLKSPLPAIINGIALVRNLIYTYLNSKQKPFKSFVPTLVISVLLTIIAVVIFWNNPYDIIMIVSILLLSIGLAFKNTLYVRISLMCNNSIWIIYDLSLGAYINVACDIINVLVNFTSTMIYHVILPKREKKKLVLNKTTETNEIIEEK